MPETWDSCVCLCLMTDHNWLNVWHPACYLPCHPVRTSGIYSAVFLIRKMPGSGQRPQTSDHSPYWVVSGDNCGVTRPLEDIKTNSNLTDNSILIGMRQLKLPRQASRSSWSSEAGDVLCWETGGMERQFTDKIFHFKSATCLMFNPSRFDR